MASAKLNTKKPYSRCVGNKKASFFQDGKYFDRAGVLVGDAPKAFVRGVKKLDEAAESKEDVLARAERVAGNLDNTGGDTLVEPKSLVDAAKENAAALAAEELNA